MKRRHGMTKKVGVLTVAGALCGAVALGGQAQAAVATNTSALRAAVTVGGVMKHLQAFQAIADANDGNRAAGTIGHAASVDYVEAQLEAAGYDTWRQPFSYERTDFTGSTMSQVAPAAVDYVFGVDYYPMDYSGGGTATAPVTAVDINLTGDRASTSGCEAADFAGFTAGHIALIQRGTCAFAVKADNAIAAASGVRAATAAEVGARARPTITAGASAVIVFNQGNVVPGDDRSSLFGGTLESPPRDIPVVSASFDQGAQWANTQALVLSIGLQITITQVQTENLLADTPSGRADRTVVVGGHLDSVAEGPGINDNGSGPADGRTGHQAHEPGALRVLER